VRRLDENRILRFIRVYSEVAITHKWHVLPVLLQGERHMPDHIRVLLADDHVLVRQGIRQFLEDEADIDVIAEADNGVEAVRLAQEHQPDVAVLDIRMPEMTGVEATRRIKAQSPGVRVLVLTAYDDDPYVFAVLQAGADGYVLKTSSAEQLVRAVRTVYGGNPALSPEVASKVIQQVTGAKPSGAVEQVEPLTQRELDVLRLAARGMTNREIGHELDISHRTVQGHLASVYEKLGVNSRTEAVTEALKRGWIVIE
jgi:DNA-binding NarL/FixJ family response regulator